MSRLPVLLGIAAAGAGGYVLGRRDRYRASFLGRVVRAFSREFADGEAPASDAGGWSRDTEFDHIVERERAERHRVAEEIKQHPLRAPAPPEDVGLRPARERQRPDDRISPRSF